MRAFVNLKISTKILALMLVLGALSLAIAFLGKSAIGTVNSDYLVQTDIKMPNNVQLVRVNRRVSDIGYGAYRTLANDGASAEARAGAQAEQQAYNSAHEILKIVEAAEPALRSRLETMRAKLDEIHQVARRAIEFGLRNENDFGAAAMRDADKLIDAFGADMKAFNDARIEEARKQSSLLNDKSASTGWTMLGMSFFGTLALLIAALFLVRKTIASPIKQLSETMRILSGGNTRVDVAGTARGDEIGEMSKAVLVFREAAVAKDLADAEKAKSDAEQKLVVETLAGALDQLSQGNLTANVREEFHGSYAELKRNFNEALASLRDLIGSVTESTVAIRTGSGEIAQASEDLARRTEANAASLEETSAAVTQMDGRLKATAEAANRTVLRADGAIATVQGGRTVADEAVQAMTRVADGAQGIDSVIEGLDKIAFQTRVLAMNAAVEAGRAGEAGRGFAVVADLVSALAMRSEEEAARAREQLTATRTDIVSAVEMVQKVDLALADISGDVAEVHSLLGQMATDNQAQSTAISQISVAIGAMDQSTQQNAAMVEETSAAARNLSSEVLTLAEQTTKFNIGGGELPKSFSPAGPSTRRIGTDLGASATKRLPASISPRGPGGDWSSF